MEIVLKGYIDSQMLSSLEDQLKNYKPGEDIFISIDSLGGFLNIAFQICEIIIQLKQYSNVSIINVGNVMSAGTVIWLSVDNRIWNQNKGEFLIHNPYLDNFKGDSNDFIEAAIDLTELEQDLVEVYSAASGKPESEILERMRMNTPMSLEELIDYRFITEVI